MPEPNNNIFLTTENLAFSLPLILVCTIYVYFKYIPLHIALSILGVVFLMYQLRAQFHKQREKKLTHLDERAIRDIVGGDFDDEDDDDGKENDATRKAKNKVKMRLAQEQKAERRKAANNLKQKKKGGGVAVSDDEDEDALETFAKSGIRTGGKSKKK